MNVDLRHDAICQAACRQSLNARASNDGFQVQDFSNGGVRIVTQNTNAPNKIQVPPHSGSSFKTRGAGEADKSIGPHCYHICVTENCNTSLCSTPSEPIPCQVLHTPVWSTPLCYNPGESQSSMVTISDPPPRRPSP